MRGGIWKGIRRIARRTTLAAFLVAGLFGWWRYHRRHEFDGLIREAASQYGVDARLISAVIWKESRFQPNVVGEAGEIGLMQVTEAAGWEWARATGFYLFSPVDLFDPANNIQAGTWYLARALQRWSHHPDPLPFALAEYNAGRANVLRWTKKSGPHAGAFLEAITFPTTRRYIEDVARRYRRRVT